MIRLSVLKPFTFYRTKSPVILPEDIRKPRMNSLYTVLAPDPLSAMAWADESDNPIRFRNLSYYFVPKYFNKKLFGTSALRRDPGEEFKLAEYVQSLNKEGGQFDRVEFVTYRANAKVNMLRSKNVYYETSYLLKTVLENTHDHRLIARKMEDLIPLLSTHLHGDKALYGLDKYTTNTIIIPVNLWTRDYKNLSIFKNTTKDVFGAFINAVASADTFRNVFGDYRVVLANMNELMILDPALIPDDDPEIVMTSIKTFLRKCKSTDEYIEVEPDSEEEAKEISQAENVSKKANTTEKVIAKVIPDTAKIPKATVKKVAAAVEATAKKKKEVEIVKAGPIPLQPPKKDAFKTSFIDDDDEEEQDDFRDEYDEDREEFEDYGDDEEYQDEMDPPKTKLTPGEIITQARLSGQSVGNYQRNEMLKDRYKELSIDNRPITEVIKSEEKYVIPKKDIKANTINPAYKELKSYNFEKAYNNQLFMHDLARILLHFSKAEPSLYLLNDPVIEDISTDMDKLYMVTVEYEDEFRKRHKFKFRMPKMYQDKYLFLNEQKWNIIHQKTPFPITKIGPDRAQVVSNYNKILLERYGQNVSAKITKIKKILEGPKCPNNVKPVRGNMLTLNKSKLTTIEYDELSSKFSQISIDGLKIYFSVDDAATVIPPPPNNIADRTVYPIAGNRRTGKYYYLSGTTNAVYDQDGTEYGELSDWIISRIAEKNPDFSDMFSEITAGTKFMYVRGKIMGTWMPLILILSAADPGGLQAVLDKGKIKYEFVSEKPKGLDSHDNGVIQFSDGYLIFERYPYENSLLMNGLAAMPTTSYSFYDMGARDTYVEIFDIMYDKRMLIDGIKSFYFLEIDPITEDVLNHLGQPTEFTRLLLMANGVMADNSYDMDSAYYQCRLRSNEVILAYLYDLLAKAYERYVGRGEKFSIPEDALIKALMKSNIIETHSKLNIALELEGDNQVKLKGPHGMNEDRSFTLEKRAYHPSMQGIIGMNSTYSGEVAINRHMSLNSNVIDARGFVQADKGDYDGTEIETPAELLNPFDAESADAERVAMAISQSKHYVPVKDVSPTLVGYDMERVAPYMSKDYATVSRMAGKVIEISNDIMIIQYDDGTYQDVDLSEHADKNTDGGFFVMSQQITHLNVGDRFEGDEILAYDPKVISDKDMFGDNLSCSGTMARVAIVSNGAVFEDATYMTDEMAERMSAYITTDKTVHLSRFTNIKKIVKKGQNIQANEPILYFEEIDDEFGSQMLQQLANEAEDDDEITASMAPVFSKVTGVVKDIKIYYTCDIEDMSPSLQKLVKNYNSQVSKRHKTIEKYIKSEDAQSIVPPCEKVVPDSTGRVKGKKMIKDVMIEFYIEYKDKYKVGDKLTNMYALKGVCSNIIPKGQEGFTEFNPERKIDAYLSAVGLFKRMVFSLEKTGTLTKILIEKKRLLKNKYIDQLKAELGVKDE